MNQSIISYVEQDMQSHVTGLVTKYQTIIKMLIQYAGGRVDKSKAQSQTDIIEALDLVETVVSSRLSTSPDEWKNDHKQKYKALFNSIETEAKQAVHINFAAPNEHGVGFVISKFQQLVIETIVDILRAVGPENAKHVNDAIIDDARETARNVKQQFHDDDAHVAQHVLRKYIQQRGSTSTKMSKKERLQVIAKVVERMQVSDEETEQ